MHLHPKLTKWGCRGCFPMPGGFGDLGGKNRFWLKSSKTE